ncbi:DUF1194 domain-containing protein [Polycladidibacter hongkongensis]|uniref:DUF1194 domain-containing protein n=1 Tax=Polycladidibacter hongkongensis TaxID=1647556 RepID=UPI0009EAF6B2|nr:DUF1194 domain-containing protein [Pseudovibrio hongkongensis]
MTPSRLLQFFSSRKSLAFLRFCTCFTALCLLAPPTTAQAEFPVDVELILAVDISQSMDPDEQRIQREGYVAALTSDAFIDTIEFGPSGRIAAMYYEWGGENEQFIVADWQIISDRASAIEFANRIAESPLRKVQRTSLSASIDFARAQFQSNSYKGLRQVLDVSGDGPNNQGRKVVDARDEAVSAGVIINGLPLMLKDQNLAWQSILKLDDYYNDCVIGGAGSFAIPVRDKNSFKDAIQIKLIMEVAGIKKQLNNLHTAKQRKPVNCAIFN